jgi:mxaJ protein
MCSACLRTLVVLAALSVGGGAAARELRVCADPNNMPFSNDKREGFENRIVEIVAAELGATLEYTWWAQRRGFVSNALDTGLCDLIPGIAAVDGVLLTYPPYYRSSYVFVTRSDEAPLSSFDDPRLKSLQVGVQLIGDGTNTPPAAALARRGITENIHGYPVYGDYRQASPPSRIVAAVASGEIDVALAWGPMAGYFASRQPEPLTVTPVARQTEPGQLPMAFDISMGLRLDEGALLQEVEAALTRRKADIDAVLAEYGVPRLDEEER